MPLASGTTSQGVEPPFVGRGKAVGIVAASGAAAVAAFLIQWMVGRFQSESFTAEFLVYWSLIFGVFGVIAGMQNETTRAVGAAQVEERVGVPALWAGLILGGGVGLLVLGSSPLWAATLVPSTNPWVIVVIAVAVLFYACHATLSGALSGQEQWGWFSGLMGAEALGRLAFVGVALASGIGLLGVEAAVALGALVWLVCWLASPVIRDAARARADAGLGRLLRNHAFAIASSASSAALITGFPVLMRFTRGDANDALLASTILAISLTRSPIMIPLQAFQGVAITAFLKSGRGSSRALVKPMAALAVLGVGGAMAAALLGPWLMGVLFAGKFTVTSFTFAGLMLAATTLAMLTLTGTRTPSSFQHTICASAASITHSPSAAPRG